MATLPTVKPVTLRCPLCDKWYEFKREEISRCEGCGHEVQEADFYEDVPRIVPHRFSRSRWWLLVLVLGFALLYWYPIGSMIGFVFIIAAIAVGSKSDRCGNCGADLNARSRRLCVTCGANISFGVH